jgi:hypothetical protein
MPADRLVGVGNEFPALAALLGARTEIGEIASSSVSQWLSSRMQAELLAEPRGISLSASPTVLLV